MVRIALCVALALSACTPAQAPKARQVGQVLSLAGVAGLVITAATTSILGGANTKALLIGFSATSAVGIGTYAAGDLADPGGPKPETIPQRNHRWAKILTQRAMGAAREGRCPRVRRLEIRVRIYDPDIHDFVFMRDAEILACLTGASTPAGPLPVQPVHPLPAPPPLPPLPPLPGSLAPAEGPPPPPREPSPVP